MINPDPGLMAGPHALPVLEPGKDGITMSEFGKYANDLRRVCVANRTQTRQLQAFIRKLRKQTEK